MTRSRRSGLEINLASRVVRREGAEVRLTPIEFKLLRVLVGHPGRVLTHAALLREVWGTAYEEDRQTLRAHIANLRRELDPTGGPPLIRTDHADRSTGRSGRPVLALRGDPMPARRHLLERTA